MSNVKLGVHSEAGKLHKVMVCSRASPTCG